MAMSRIIRPETLSGVSDFIYYHQVEQQINDYVDGKRLLIEADTTRFGMYDQNFRWLRGEVTGFAGIPNHGKSKFVIFLSALKMYYDNWKCAFYSPETTPPEFFFGNYIHTLTGYSLFSKSLKPTKIQVAHHRNLLEKNLYLCEPEKLPTFKGILERFTKAYEYHKPDMFVIDPFNTLERDWENSKRDDRYVGDFLEHVKEFAKKTDTCLVIVMHPNAGIKTKKDGIDLECPNMYNLAGGAMWGNKLDNLIFVHRPNFLSNREDSTVLLRHSKIKKREIVGLGGDVYLDFNFRTNRYSVCGYEPPFITEAVQLVINPYSTAPF